MAAGRSHLWFSPVKEEIFRCWTSLFPKVLVLVRPSRLFLVGRGARGSGCCHFGMRMRVMAEKFRSVRSLFFSCRLVFFVSIVCLPCCFCVSPGSQRDGFAALQWRRLDFIIRIWNVLITSMCNQEPWLQSSCTFPTGIFVGPRHWRPFSSLTIADRNDGNSFKRSSQQTMSLSNRACPHKPVPGFKPFRFLCADQATISLSNRACEHVDRWSQFWQRRLDYLTKNVVGLSRLTSIF